LAGKPPSLFEEVRPRDEHFLNGRGRFDLAVAGALRAKQFW
jgi:hypothetical protein